MKQRSSLEVLIGFASETGKRAANEDFVAALSADAPQARSHGIAAALADGMGGHKGGRQASELTVRSFLDGYYAMPATLGPQKAASRSLEAINHWIHAQGRADPQLLNMGTTFSALIFRRRSAFSLHVGDSRIYRFSEGRLERLTEDHTLGRGDLSHVLKRAIGLEDYVRVDNGIHALKLRDRFLICSDGVHAPLGDARIAALLADAQAPEDTAKAIISAALEAGSEDNVTALVADILDIPAADQSEIAETVVNLPILDLPKSGDKVDGFSLGTMLSDGHYSRIFRATKEGQPRDFVLKFPHPKVAADATYRLAFIREAYVAARVRSPWIGEIIEPAAGEQTRLYSIMPFYEGETLERRLGRHPPLTLGEGIVLARNLARAIATLHRAGIIHRDIKPDNIILDPGGVQANGGLRLVDLGVARVPQMEDFAAEDIPGTPSFMAPELFAGSPGDEASDQFALGVTLYRALSGAYPYGEIEPFSRPRFGKPVPLSRYRPDLPAWLSQTIAKALAVNPAERFSDVIEFALEIENGEVWNRKRAPVKKTLYSLAPLFFWKMTSAILLILFIAALASK